MIRYTDKKHADCDDILESPIEVEAKEVGLNMLILTVQLDVWLTVD
jgi:hypothetical protein